MTKNRKVLAASALIVSTQLLGNCAWALSPITLECSGKQTKIRDDKEPEISIVKSKYTIYARSLDEQRMMAPYVDSVGTKSRYGKYYDFEFGQWYAIVSADDNLYVLEDTRNLPYNGLLTAGLMSSSNKISRGDGVWNNITRVLNEKTRKPVLRLDIVGECKKIPLVSPPSPKV